MAGLVRVGLGRVLGDKGFGFWWVEWWGGEGGGFGFERRWCLEKGRFGGG